MMTKLYRRSLLAGGGLGLTGVAGFLGGTSSGRATLDTLANAAGQPIRCRGDPVSASLVGGNEPGYDDEIEYYPENRTVRFVTLSNSTGPVAFGTKPFETWGTWRCAEVALGRVRVVTADRLGTDGFSSGGQLAPELAVNVRVTTVKNRDGEVTSKPSSSLSELVDAAPKTVEVTYTLEGDSVSRSIPVFARETTARNT